MQNFLKTMGLILIFIFLSLLNRAFCQDYLWPTDASHAMTSSFAESRPWRFHAGIDIKTWGQVGYDIYAIRSGYISRIRVSPYGYGRALYLTLDTGETVVYGHLSKFNKEIEEYVWQQQQKRERFAIQLYPPKHLFNYQQGELLGFTGQTGVGFPHLHFEIRDRANHPINPFYKGYKVDDTVTPVITKVSIVPMDAYSRINGDFRPIILYARYVKPGRYEFDAVPVLNGKISFGVSAYDQMNDIPNKFGTYHSELFVNEQKIFDCKYNRFSYFINHHANLDRDFRLFSQGKGNFYRLYREIGNDLPFYDGKVWSGVIDCAPDMVSKYFDVNFNYLSGLAPNPNGMVKVDSGMQKIKIVLADFWGNKSILSGKIRVGLDETNTKKMVSRPVHAVDEEIEFNLTTEYYDSYVRLKLNASRPLAKKPRILGWHSDGSIEKVHLTPQDAQTFIGAWSIAKETSGPIPLEIHYLDESGKQIIQKNWLAFDVVLKGDRKTLYTLNGKCWIEFANNALFRNIYVRKTRELSENKSRYDFVGSIYTIDPNDVPLDKGATLSIAYDETDSLQSKIGLYARAGNGFWVYQSHKHNISGRSFSTKVKNLGSFCLIRDTEAPVIEWLYPADQSSLQAHTPRLSAKFRDSLSGIRGEDNMVLALDGQRLISEYDPESRTLFHQIQDALESGKHTVSLYLSDRQGNKTRASHTFWIK